MLKNLKSLFFSFFKIGLFTFGGGYAMIPLMEKEAVEKRKWITEEDILDILTVAESTPGVLAINMATFVGYKIAGFFGALVATIAVSLPSFIVIIIVSFFINEFKENKWVSYAFNGIRAGVVILMFNAVMKLSKSCRKGLFNIIIIGVAFLISTLFESFDIIFILIGAAMAGIIFNSLSLNRKKGE